MNVFWRELKSYRKGLLFWGIGMIALVGSGMAKFATISSTGQSMTSLLDQFPSSVKIIFGLTGFDLDQASGYFGVLFIYIALMAATHAALLGAGIISKEERDRTSEFLFVKPLSRFKIVTAKLLAGLLNVGLLNLVTSLASLYFVGLVSKGTSATDFIVVSMAGLLMLQLLFFFVGTTVAALNRRPKSSSSIATSILLFCYILTYFINLNGQIDSLKYLTPFKYFDAKDMLSSGQLNPGYVGLSLFLMAIMVSVTYRAYNRRDLTV
ncbi:MAG: ABC transporter permease subunit [Candidatus Saccharibacteria bacterium]